MHKNLAVYFSTHVNICKKHKVNNKISTDGAHKTSAIIKLIRLASNWTRRVARNNSYVWRVKD